MKNIIERAVERIEASASDRQVEAGKRLFSALEGDRQSRFWLQEGIATSDVAQMLTPAVNVIFLNQYAEAPSVWSQIAERYVAPGYAVSGETVRWGGFDFDQSALKGDQDGETFVGMGLPGVGEYDEYPAIKFVTRELEAGGRKGGERLRFSWEVGVATGDFDWLRRATRRFAYDARMNEDVKLARQFVSTAGVPNALFTTITGNPALTLTALEAALEQAASALAPNGVPLNASEFALVVSPGLARTAERILAITQVTVNDQSQGVEYQRAAATGGVTVVPFSAMQAVGNYTTPGTVDDFWFLVPKGTPNPAFVEVFLEGNETPLITVKDSGHFTLGGAQVPIREGNFTHDDIETRVRHWVGAAYLADENNNPEVPVYGSTGAGS